MVSVRLAAAAALMLLAGCDTGQSSNAPSARDRLSGSDTASADTASVDNRFPLPYPQPVIPEYSVGQDVEIVAQSAKGWEPAKVVEVTTVNGGQVVRTTWPGTDSGLPYLISTSRRDDIRLPTGRLGQDLLIGRYICYDGGTDRSDLNFRVAEYGQYTDPYGDRPGTFVTSGDRITFTGGVLDGQTAEQLRNNSEFYFTPQFKCRWQAEGL